MAWLGLLAGLVAAKADACSVACFDGRNLTLQSVVMDGQPLADTSAWQPWRLVLMPRDGGWQLSGSVEGPCPPPAVDNCSDATANCPEASTVQDAGAPKTCTLAYVAEVWDAK